MIFCKVPSHTGVVGNEQADQAAKQATEIPGYYTHTIPHQDIYYQIKRNIRNEWQKQWNNTTAKLKIIKPMIKHWHTTQNDIRKWEVKLTRLRIGHTRLTHGHYMEKRAAPTCTYCPNKILTVEHILVECPKIDDMRNKMKLPRRIEELLGENCPIKNLMTFLTQADLLEEI